jgi:hypothetical protein
VSTFLADFLFLLEKYLGAMKQVVDMLSDLRKRAHAMVVVSTQMTLLIAHQINLGLKQSQREGKGVRSSANHQQFPDIVLDIIARGTGKWLQIRQNFEIKNSFGVVYIGGNATIARF